MQQPRQKSKLSQKQKLHSYRSTKPPSIPSTTRVQQVTKTTPYSQLQITPKGQSANKCFNSNQQRLRQHSPIEFLDEDNFQSFTPQVGISQVSSTVGSVTPKKKKSKRNTQTFINSQTPQSINARQGSPQIIPTTLEQIYLGKQSKGNCVSKNTSNNPFLSLKKLQVQKKQREVFKFTEDQSVSKSSEIQLLQLQKKQLQKDLVAVQKIQQMYQKDKTTLEQKNQIILKLKEELQHEYSSVKKLKFQIQDTQNQQYSLDLSQKNKFIDQLNQSNISQPMTILEGGSQNVADGLNQIGGRIVELFNNLEQTSKQLLKENNKMSAMKQEKKEIIQSAYQITLAIQNILIFFIKLALQTFSSKLKFKQTDNFI